MHAMQVSPIISQGCTASLVPIACHHGYSWIPCQEPFMGAALFLAHTYIRTRICIYIYDVYVCMYVM